MPPRKRARLSPGPTTPLQEAQSADAPTPATADTPDLRDVAANKAASDPWTDEQEISLFKGLVRFKPAGMHRHFRMIALSQFMRDHGYGSAQDAHTRIPGLWKKLASLYHLDAINEREDALIDGDETSKDTDDEPFFPFVLPKNEYLDLMLDRAPASTSSSSPPLLDMPARQTKGKPKAGAQSKRDGRASTVEDTEDEPRSSPPPLRSTKVNRSGRNIKQTPKARLQQAEARTTSTRRSRQSLAADTGGGGAGAGAAEVNEEPDEENEDDTGPGSPSVRSTRKQTRASKAAETPKEEKTDPDRRRSTRRR